MVNFKCYLWLEHLNGKLCFTSWGSLLFLKYVFRSQLCGASLSINQRVPDVCGILGKVVALVSLFHFGNEQNASKVAALFFLLSKDWECCTSALGRRPVLNVLYVHLLPSGMVACLSHL